MKKKWTQKGTITMGYVCQNTYLNFETGSISLDVREMTSAIETIAVALNLQIKASNNWYSTVYGADVAHVTFRGHVPFDRMEDFIYEAKKQGFNVKE